jgi:phosphoribosylformylglycinamidine synthase
MFNEELGAVLQVRRKDVALVSKILEEEGFPVSHCIVIGTVDPKSLDLVVRAAESNAYFFHCDVLELQRLWTETSYRMQALRDNELCAKQEFERLQDVKDPGLHYHLTFDPNKDIPSPWLQMPLLERPSVAILREQGVNGHVEMANAFDRAGFRVIDVHMSDILSGHISLSSFKGNHKFFNWHVIQFVGLAACGGFSLVMSWELVPAGQKAFCSTVKPVKSSKLFSSERTLLHWEYVTAVR